MTEPIKKRGRPRKTKPVVNPVVEGELPKEIEEKADDAKMAKRPSTDAKAIKVVITISPDGPRHIEGGGLNVFELWEVFSGCAAYLRKQVEEEMKKYEEANPGTPDTAGGSDTSGEVPSGE